jgi:glyoxylase-like metal-dependent hydrolase (beta-lactamase superfamily II)
MELAIYACGGAMTPEAILTRGAPWRWSWLPLLACALRHPERGVWLIDAPFGAEGLGALPLHQRVAFGGLGGIRVGAGEGLGARLEALGWEAPRGGLLTHGHFDHVAGMGDVPGLRWQASAAEAALLRDMGDVEALRHGYMGSAWRSRYPVEGLALDGPAVAPFGPCGDLWGDGLVRLIPLPGHSPGHMGLLLRLGQREVFWCGDAIFQIEHVTGERAPGVFPRGSARDAGRMLETLSLLRRFHAANPEVEILCAHDLGLGRRCRAAPLVVDQRSKAS